MLQIVTFSCIFIAVCHASLFCPHTKLPSDTKSFQTMRIQSKKSVGQEPMFRIANTDDTDKSFSSSSSRFRLLTRTDNVECPSKGCITELSAAQPKHQSSILYLTNIIGKMIPPGFQHIDSATRLYCVIMAGDCGATIPIYRYYKFLPSGLYHAYSTDEDVEIDGFAREPSPLCFGWPTLSAEQLRAEGREGSGEDYSSEELEEASVEVTSEERQEARQEVFQMVPEVCDNKTPPKPSSMKSLNVYVNDKAGALKDHYYTTKVANEGDEKDKDTEFYGYHLDKVETIGMVVVDEEKSKCGCLIRLSQMFDNQSQAMIPRKDHKLAVDFKEPPPTGGEKYASLEEEVWCVREEGACGATVALRKYFHILELDTVYTTDTSDVPPLTVPTPPGVLCYIWKSEKPAKKDPKKEEVAKKHKTTTTEEPTTAAPSTPVVTTSKAETTTAAPATTSSTMKSTTTSTSSTPKTTPTKAKDVPTKTIEKPSKTAKTKTASTTVAPKTTENTSTAKPSSTSTKAPSTTTLTKTTVLSSTETTTASASTSTVEVSTASPTTTDGSTTVKPKSTKTPKTDSKKKEASSTVAPKITEVESKNETMVDGVLFKFTN